MNTGFLPRFLAESRNRKRGFESRRPLHPTTLKPLLTQGGYVFSVLAPPLAGDCLATENQACTTKSPRQSGSSRSLSEVGIEQATSTGHQPRSGALLTTAPVHTEQLPPPVAEAIWMRTGLGSRAPTQRSTPTPDIELPPSGSPSRTRCPNRRLPAGNSLGDFGAGNDF
jgi:hypothetical protein